MIRFLVFALIAASDAASSALKEGAQCNLSDGQGRGICKTFNQCSWAEEQVKVGGSPSVCFFTKNDQPVVCCPDNTSGYATTTTSTDVLVSSAERITIPPSSIAQGGVVSESVQCSVVNGQGRGVCKRLSQCGWAQEQLKAEHTPSVCDLTNKDQTTVCCPEEITGPNTTATPSTLETPSPSPLKELRRPALPASPGDVARKMCTNYASLVCQPTNVLEGSHVLADLCSVGQPGPQIVGGTFASPKEFPHMALIGYGNRSDIQYFCGGSLISHNFVLTAAHCIYRQSTKAGWVLLGDLILDSTNDVAQPELIEVAEWFVHPAYQPPAMYNDIGLLRLKHNANMSAFVRPACLQTTMEIDTRNGQPVASGWGSTEFLGGEMSNKLQKVSLALVDHQICRLDFSIRLEVPRGVLQHSQICAGRKKLRDTCQGDSGGPLQIFTGTPYCMYHVIGVTSFGSFCGSEMPGVYSRVSEYVQWIEEIVWPPEYMWPNGSGVDDAKCPPTTTFGRAMH